MMDDLDLARWLRADTIAISSEDDEETMQLFELFRDLVHRFADHPEQPTAIELEAALAVTCDMWVLHRDARRTTADIKEILDMYSGNEARRNTFRLADDRFRLREHAVKSMEQMVHLLEVAKKPALRKDRRARGRTPRGGQVVELTRGRR